MTAFPLNVIPPKIALFHATANLHALPPPSTVLLPHPPNVPSLAMEHTPAITLKCRPPTHPHSPSPHPVSKCSPKQTYTVHHHQPHPPLSLPAPSATTVINTVSTTCICTLCTASNPSTSRAIPTSVGLLYHHQFCTTAPITLYNAPSIRPLFASISSACTATKVKWTPSKPPPNQHPQRPSSLNQTNRSMCTVSKHLRQMLHGWLP
mmetsp:Transcript_55879/g.88928  ORF Transcript_55879/g.88928 Transcript_55879/m.88928 type:complete len:207 (-) Transcript_55879:1292-1912(-)